VILRVFRGRGDADQVAALDDALRTEPRRRIDGRHWPERLRVGWRPTPTAAAGAEQSASDRDIVMVSHWSSPEAAAQADLAQASPIAIARRHLSEVDVAHFELDDVISRHTDDEPIAIRIATGRFSRPGADTEMQNLLRQRAPLIGDEMAEAWVGRRLTGRAIEVTFVSTWRRLPTDRPLEEAFWPDIALRYDKFVVEVYTTVG